MKLLAFLLCLIAGGLAGHFGGIGAATALAIGQIGVAILLIDHFK